jgi:hypothetical protein
LNLEVLFEALNVGMGSQEIDLLGTDIHLGTAGQHGLDPWTRPNGDHGIGQQ